MEARHLREAHTIVIVPSEDLSLDHVAPVDELIQKSFRRKVKCVVMDLERVEHCDSGGIGALVKGHHLARSLDKRFFLIGLRPNVRRIFRLSNLYKVFDICPSLDDVLFTLEGHRVLLWDDRKTVVDFYEELLTANGFVLQAVKDEGKVERLIAESPPSIILLDVQEFEEGKLDFIRALRKGAQSSIPVVVVSSYVEEENSYHFAGVDLFVSKPFRVERLIRELRKLVKEPS